jgi:hypothetical protein
LAVRKKWVSETSLERAGKRQTVYNIIHRLHMTRVESLADEAARQNIDRGELKTIVTDLKLKGLIYTPKPGTVGCVDE